ncbi:hypothetical protein JW916_11370 [Candidatus Sumerlaeota bacterium]|nr:hypothetical protein [Candidatus Sumerlaeota bacterium]
MKQLCESCGRTIEKPEISYRLKIELCADPSPPEITEEDLEKDFKEEMRRLIEEMERMDPEEAEMQVYESYIFTLCSQCRERIHDELRGWNLPFEKEL